jgi:hypothetical protein
LIGAISEAHHLAQSGFVRLTARKIIKRLASFANEMVRDKRRTFCRALLWML